MMLTPSASVSHAMHTLLDTNAMLIRRLAVNAWARD
jgi:hypothetical protein